MATARASAIAGALLLAAGRCLAQDAAHPPGCFAIHGTISPELMERPIGLDSRAGTLHQTVSTQSPKAQAYYDQGIAYLSSYVWIEAARSFNEALRLDPNLAMAQLGLAKAYEGAEDEDEARAHLNKAETLAQNGKLTEKERLWIQLGRQQLDAIDAPADAQAEQLQSYRSAIDALIALDPNDAHAWVLRGNAEEAGAWGRGQAGGVGSIAYYETALKRDPSHLAAKHFLAHSYENIGQYEIAAAYGREYAASASGVAHAQHMLGHVLPRLGKWDEARDQFIKADKIERAYYAAEKVQPEEDWHHGHNLSLLGVVYVHLGDDKDAERTLHEAFELKERGIFAGTYAEPYVEYLLLRGRNAEALNAADEVQKRPSEMEQLTGAALTGEALLGLDRIDDARAQLSRTEALQKKLETDLANTRYNRYAPAFAQSVDILRGRVLLRGDHPEDGEKILLEIADQVGSDPRLDAWASGVWRVDRAIADADKLGRHELAAQLRERTKSLN